MSYRPDTNATYDRALLSSVPDPTRAERQEGYNVDLLDEGRDRRAPSPPAPERQPTDQQPLTDGYSPGAVALAHKEGYLENGTRPAVAKTPWYRTKWGITAIVIVIVLIVGGIVGGAVGGTQHHSSNKSTNGGGNGNAGSGTPNPNGTTGGDTTLSPNHSGSVGGTGGTGTSTSADSESGPATVSSPSSSETRARASQTVSGQGVPPAAPSATNGISQ